jgi:hypothetical protein
MESFGFELLASAVWEATMAVYERMTNKSLEEMYVDAFDAGVASLKPYLKRYGNTDHIKLNKDQFREILHQEMREDLSKAAISAQTAPEFQRRLAQAMSDSHVVEIEGHNLSVEGYERVIVTVIQQAHGLFNDAVSKNKEAFNRVVLNEVALLQQKADQTHQSVLASDAATQSQFGKLGSDLNSVRENTAPREPHIRVGFTSNQDILSEIRVTPKIQPEGGQTDSEIEQRLNDRVEMIRQTIEEARRKYTKPPMFPLTYKQVTEEELENYEEEALGWIDTFRAMLKAKRSRGHGKRFAVTIGLSNDGPITAKGVRVVILFPNGTCLVRHDEIGKDYSYDLLHWDLPVGLSRPPWKSDRDEWMVASIAREAAQAPRPAYSFYIGPHERNRAIIEVDSLLPGEYTKQPPIMCYIPREIQDMVNVRYKVVAEELSQPIVGTTRILLDEDSASAGGARDNTRENDTA